VNGAILSSDPPQVSKEELRLKDIEGLIAWLKESGTGNSFVAQISGIQFGISRARVTGCTLSRG
jgi:hypothetical protein